MVGNFDSQSYQGANWVVEVRYADSPCKTLVLSCMLLLEKVRQMMERNVKNGILITKSSNILSHEDIMDMEITKSNSSHVQGYTCERRARKKMFPET